MLLLFSSSHYLIIFGSKNIKKWGPYDLFLGNHVRQPASIHMIFFLRIMTLLMSHYSEGGKKTYYCPITTISMCVIKLAKIKL
jgi:hypothetical protein